MWILRKSFPQYEFPWMFFPSFKRWIRQSWRSHQDFLWHAKERRKVGEEGPVSIFAFHLVWKLTKMSHLNLAILAYSTNFQKFAKIWLFGIFNENVNLARLARNVEWDFFMIFKHRGLFKKRSKLCRPPRILQWNKNRKRASFEVLDKTCLEFLKARPPRKEIICSYFFAWPDSRGLSGGLSGLDLVFTIYARP